MRRNVTVAMVAFGALLSLLPLTAGAAGRKDGITAWITTRDGQNLEGTLKSSSLSASIGGKTRELPLKDVLSIQIGAPASPQEEARITSGLAALQGTDHKAQEAAVADLTDIGVPVMSPLLATYKDTDAHEPNLLYHLFARIMPGYADQSDRTLDLIRLADGQALRGRVAPTDLKVTGADGKETAVPLSNLRRLAVRRKNISKLFALQALRHCVHIEFLDAGVGVTRASKIEEIAEGFVRLAFDVEGWTCGPDGLKVPGPHYQSNLVDGFPFGAIVGRIGPTGARWMAGRHVEKTPTDAGRLYLGVNDNPHWQNNIGSFRVFLRATDAYDLGDPQ